ESTRIVVDTVVVTAEPHQVITALKGVLARKFADVLFVVEVLLDVEARVGDVRNAGDIRHAAGADVGNAKQGGEICAVTRPGGIVAEPVIVDARLADQRGAD